ncbi:hypothetical protein KCP78_20610 [Salmonella enterica subsp. enterica]|nr:hypothetical protein KCP78_20610 [Salmonella enterica subsp. enterica]
MKCACIPEGTPSYPANWRCFCACEPGGVLFIDNGDKPRKGVFIKSPHLENDSHPADPPARNARAIARFCRIAPMRALSGLQTVFQHVISSCHLMTCWFKISH